MFVISAVISQSIFFSSFHLSTLVRSGSAVMLGGKCSLQTLTSQSVCLEHDIYLSASHSATQHSLSAHQVLSTVLGAKVFICIGYYLLSF